MKLKLFLEYIEDIYVNESIYRSIILANDETDANNIYSYMSSNNHNVLYIDKIEEIGCIGHNGDYKNSDYRVFIILKELFYNFINIIDKSSYNFIGISYNIDKHSYDNILNDYLNISNNNNVIISDYIDILATV